jgi:hypothetical protein
VFKQFKHVTRARRLLVVFKDTILLSPTCHSYLYSRTASLCLRLERVSVIAINRVCISHTYISCYRSSPALSQHSTRRRWESIWQPKNSAPTRTALLQASVWGQPIEQPNLAPRRPFAQFCSCQIARRCWEIIDELDKSKVRRRAVNGFGKSLTNGRMLLISELHL